MKYEGEKTNKQTETKKTHKNNRFVNFIFKIVWF